MKRKPRVPATKSQRDYVRPTCKEGHTDLVRVHGQWMCVECLPVWVNPTRMVELPEGVKDPDTLTIRDVFPNRKARRAAGAHK